MSKSVRVPTFGRFLDALIAAGVVTTAGVETKNARGFWGGVTKDDELVVSSWTDANDGNGRFYIWRPKTDHGRLRTAWEMSRIQVGVEVQLILVRQQGTVPLDVEGRSVAGAALMPGKWRIVKLLGRDKAVVEPISAVHRRSAA